MSRFFPIFLASAVLHGCSFASAQVTFTATAVADAFVASGSVDNPDGTDLTGLNFGAAGMLAVAPAGSVKGEFRGVLRFDLSGALGLFNETFGSNWLVRGISLELASNYGTNGVQPNNPLFNVVSGGKFVIEWMSDSSWVEGTGTPNLPTTDGITFSSLPTYLSTPHQVLCTNTYVPPGDNVHVTWPLPLNGNLVANAEAGGVVSFYLWAADSQVNYLFNSHEYGRGNEPLIHITAVPLIRFVAGYFTNGLFHLEATGGTNALYWIEANSDLCTTNWQTIGPVTTSSTGILRFDDANALTGGRRFYRVSN